MKITTRPSILASLLGLTVASLAATIGNLSAIDTSKLELTTTPWVLDLLGARKEVFDSKLGKSEQINDFEVYSKKDVIVSGLFVAIGYEGKACHVDVEFKKDPGSWKSALRVLGLEPGGVVEQSPATADSSHPRGFVTLKKIKKVPAKWTVTYTPAHKGQNPEGVEYQAGSTMSFYLDQ